MPSKQKWLFLASFNIRELKMKMTTKKLFHMHQIRKNIKILNIRNESRGIETLKLCLENIFYSRIIGEQFGSIL